MLSQQQFLKTFVVNTSHACVANIRGFGRFTPIPQLKLYHG